MATNKLTMKFRSITYPNSDSSSQNKKQRGRLQRMPSFDLSVSESPTAPVKSCSRREVSAEGRLRVQQFQHTHSSSSSSNTLAPGQKLLRFSDECWCSLPGEPQPGRPHTTSSSCLTSPKSKSGSAVRYSTSTNMERLVDWQRQPPDRHNVSPSSSQDLSQRHSRSKERRTDRDSTTERRSHYCTSVSLPPPGKPSEQTAAVANTPTTPTVTTEARGRRSQFRRAWSLFSLTCDKEVERERREKSPQQKILRPPTRHFYRRGLSGLPIECSTRYLGLAY